MEEKVVFYFSLIAGMLLFVSILIWGGQVNDIALEGEARVLIGSLQDITDQVKSSPRDTYVQAEFPLPEKLSGKSYEVRFLPSLVRVKADSNTFEGSIEVSNSMTVLGGEVLLFYRDRNSGDVFVTKIP